MRKIVKVLVLTLFVTMSGVFPVSAAENPLTVTSAEISVMPEYDTSDVLVLYALRYVNNSDEPYAGEIRFPVPKETTNNIVKEDIPNSDSHLNVRVEDHGDYAELVWTPAGAIEPKASYPIHLEYYYNPLPGTGEKTFEYRFIAPTAVEKASIGVLQPLKATDFKMDPSGIMMGQTSDGFNTYGLDRSGLKPGDEIKFTVSYKKDDPNPSVKPPWETQGAQSQPGTNESSQLANPAVIIPLALLAVFIVIIILKNKEWKSSGDGTEEPVTKQKRSGKTPKGSKISEDKRRLREMLLNGEISEDTYLVLLRDIEGER